MLHTTTSWGLILLLWPPFLLAGSEESALDPAVLRTLRSLSVAHHLGNTALHLLLVDCQDSGPTQNYGRC